jgi:hypothetical protein
MNTREKWAPVIAKSGVAEADVPQWLCDYAEHHQNLEDRYKELGTGSPTVLALSIRIGLMLTDTDKFNIKFPVVNERTVLSQVTLEGEVRELMMTDSFVNHMDSTLTRGAADAINEAMREALEKSGEGNSPRLKIYSLVEAVTAIAEGTFAPRVLLSGRLEVFSGRGERIKINTKNL